MFARIKRLLKHRWMDDASRSVAPEVSQRLTRRVAASEQQHSGQIRICVEAALPNSYLLRQDSIRAITRQRAVAQFGKLRVWDTQHNNGVLIYLLLAERAIELVADRGLNQYVTPEQWQAMVQSLGLTLSEGRFEDGLTRALEEVTELLVAHFPLAEGEASVNELPDKPAIL